jgi:hypothetical protein
MYKSYLHYDANHNTLGLIRVGVFTIWLILIINSPTPQYAYLPASSFEPWGIYRLLFDIFSNEILLSLQFLTGLKVALIICCVACLIGLRPWKVLAIITTILLFIHDGIVQSFYGFANHAQLGIQFCTIILTLFPSADAWSICGPSDSKYGRKQYKAGLLVLTVTLCLPYMFIGTNRILYGGIDLFTGDSILHYLSIRDLQYAKYNIDSGYLIFDYPSIFPIFKIGLLLTTVFEVLTPFTLVSNIFRRIWLAVIIPFHFFTLISMNIFFWENLLLINLLLTRFPYLINGINQETYFK